MTFTKSKFSLMLIACLLFLFTGVNPVFSANGWQDQWLDEKDDYVQTTGEKKPKGGFFQTSHIEKALKKADAALANAENSPSRKNIKTFEKAIKTFASNKNKYQKVLSKEIKNTSEPEKKKALGELGAILDVIYGDMENELAALKSDAGSAQLADTTEGLPNKCDVWVSNRAVWKKFKEYAESAHIDENTDFLENYYRVKIKQKTAEKFYNVFIAPGSSKQVNIDHNQLQNIQNNCLEENYNQSACTKAFADAEQEICSMIINDRKNKFIKWLRSN